MEHPQIQRVLAHPPTASVTRMNSGEGVELFDGGWLELAEGLPHVRVIVVRHPAPPPGKNIAVGKRVGEWVYELFLTILPTDGFLVEDVLDLYHGRGAFEAVRASEDIEEDPDRWCSYTECGQELWQIACQWVWNLRLSTLERRCKGASYVRWSGLPPKKHLPCSWLRKTRLRSMDHGSGRRRLDAPRDVWEQRPLCCKKTGGCAAQRGPACG